MDINEISKKAQIIKFNKHEPTKNQLILMQNVILQFIEKKKKMYGGAAMHLLKLKNDEGIYKDNPEVQDDIYDVEFYSPEPKKDLHEICDLIFKKDLIWVTGIEAGHDETFSIQYLNIRICDISFVPPNIYGLIPTTKYKNLLVSSPEFIMIDIYRQRANPSNSFYKLEKV